MAQEPKAMMDELVFEVSAEDEGGFSAHAQFHDGTARHTIVTQGETWQELRAMVQDAVSGHFDEGTEPVQIRLRLVRDEVLMAA